MKLTTKQELEFREAARPLIEFLNLNCHPHITVTVDANSAELSEGISRVIVDDYLRD